ncbi:3423_t:CDS:2, partial [Scutellospora calospora]
YEINKIPNSEKNKVHPKTIKKQYYGRAKIIEDTSQQFGLKKFNSESAYQFYDVNSIKYVVRYFNIGSEYYIIDKNSYINI